MKSKIKYLIQKIEGKVVHDFSFTLLESINYVNWCNNGIKTRYKYFNTKLKQTDFEFKPIHNKYVPVGSVEFVTAFLKQMYDLTPKPKNVPESLFPFAGRAIFNGTEKDLVDSKFVKSNDRIKARNENDESITGVYNGNHQTLPKGNYQISDVIRIDVEYRCFVYKNSLRGIQYYSGDFALFPNVKTIMEVIRSYMTTSPIAYTLDVGVNEYGTFVVEVHDFFSCGLYGFADHTTYSQMLYAWFYEYVSKNVIK
jgi:hypothetical protein